MFEYFPHIGANLGSADEISLFFAIFWISLESAAGHNFRALKVEHRVY
jgi:hypothetical protein